MKRVALAISITLVVIVGIFFCVPSLRDSIFGASLGHKLEVGRPDGVTVLAMVLVGTEIRELSSPVSFAPSDTIIPEVFDISLNMQEMVETAGHEDSVLYNISEAKSEQIGNTGVGGLVGCRYRLRMPQTGLITELKRTEGKGSRIFDDTRLTEALAGWWPALPNKRVSLGDTWNGYWDAAVPCSVLDGKIIKFRHNVTCTYEETVPAGQLTLAKLSIKGSIVPNSSSDLPKDVEILGMGNIEGTAMVCIENGCSVVCDNHSAYSYVVRMKNDNMEVAQLFDIRERIFRPRMLPNGGNGFNSELPGDDTALPNLKEAMKASSPAPAKVKSQGGTSTATPAATSATTAAGSAAK